MARSSSGRDMRRVRVVGLLAAGLIVACSAIVAKAQGGPDKAVAAVPDQSILTKHVGVLASQEYQGRSGDGGRKAARYLIETFQRLGLEPLFDGGFEQSIHGFGSPAEVVLGHNVGAVLRGSDPELRDEWIILSAHYDHLGVRGVVFPGADDNASGVAMMLEVARTMSELPQSSRPRRSIAFVGFDLEERGLWGSRYFVEKPPIPLEHVRLFITADMIGRSLGGVCDEFVFVMGTEFTPGLRLSVENASQGLALKPGVVGSDLLLFDRSDYGPFRKRKIPYLFFSTGESPVYHTPRDVPETIDYPKLTEISRLIQRVLADATQVDSLPGWAEKPEHALSEALAVREVLIRLLEHQVELSVKPLHASWLKSQINDLDQAIRRGVLTPIERRRMVINAQLIIYSIL